MQASASNIFNVIFEAGRGTCPVRSREARTGEPLGELPVATREGYTFAGWFSAPGGKGEAIDATRTLAQDGDITLYAHYIRRTGRARKRSSLRTQKRALTVLLIAIVALALLLPAVNYIVSIIPFVDPADGAKYYARQKDGVYAIYDADGERLPVNESGYYLAASGTQLSLNGETGAITEYAVVDTEGSEIVSVNSRILMFAQIRQPDIARIEVKNAHGSYTFYTDKNGTVCLEGYEQDKGYLVSYDKEKYAALCVSAGYPLTLRKLDTAEVLKRGYAEYGLEAQTRTDEQGNEYEYTPASYTVTSKTGVRHSVLIGDPIVTEAGYYVKLAGDDHAAVYIMSNTNYDSSLMLPVEQMITPMITYPASNSNYFDVRDFVLSRADGDKDELDVQVGFDFISLEERESSLYTSTPYVPTKAYPYQSYRLHNDTVSSTLEALANINFVGVRKLGVDEQTLAEYGLDRPEFILTYDLYVDTDGDSYTDKPVSQALFISPLTKDGTYLVFSPLCDVIAEVTRASLFFLENDALDWINERVIWFNLAFVRRIDARTPDGRLELVMDNSASDQSSSISSANITFTINGKTPDYIVYTTSASSGKVTEQTPVYNLRQLYKGLLALSVGGSTSEGHFTLTKEQMDEYRAMDDSACQLVLRIDAEDMAATYNPTYHSENNKTSLVYRFYRYSEGRSYLTINGEGEFFVDAAYVDKLIADLWRLETGVLINPDSKT